MVFIRKQKRKDKTYYYVVSNKRVDGKVKQKTLLYLGTPETILDRIEKLKLKDAKLKDIKSYDYGEVKVLYDICKELNLVEIFNKHTTKGGGISVGQLSLIVIINHCLEARSKVKISRWFKRTYLPQLMGISAGKANKDSLTSVLDYLTEARIKRIEDALRKQLFNLFKLNKKCLMYDITSTYVYGDKCNLADYGYNRDGVNEKQINLGLVVSKQGKFPLLHKIFNGKTVDVTTVQQTSNEVKKRLQIPDNSCMLILDRGMVSRKNLEHLDAQTFGYIVGLSKSSNYTKDLIKEAKNFADINAEVSAFGSELLHNGKKKKFVVLLNEKIRKRQAQKRTKLLAEKEKQLERLKKNAGKRRYKNRNKLIMRIGELTKGVRKYFNIKISKDSANFDYSIKESALHKQEVFDGKFVICCTDTDMSAKEIWMAYNDKDKAEKAFRTIKCFIKVRPIRHWKPNRVKAHIFLCIVAYLIQKVLEYKLRELNLSAQEVIDQLRDIKLISYTVGDKNIEKKTQIGPKQTKILEDLRTEFI